VKHPAELTYAAFRLRGATRRYLFCRTDEKPHFGDNTFDFLGYFGFGSGEFGGEHPQQFDGLRVKVQVFTDPEFALAYISTLMTQPTDGFSGFFTHDGYTFHVVTEDAEGVPLTHLKALNWHYYTNVGGSKKLAHDHIVTLNRRHVLFATYEEQSALLTRYAKLAGVF
jgi:hypothetical protein